MNAVQVKLCSTYRKDRKEMNECHLITNYSLDRCVKRKNKPNKELNLYDCVAGAFLYDDSEMTEHGKN